MYKAKAYSQISATEVDASPHRIVQKVLETILTKIAASKGFMQRGEIEAKGASVSAAMDLISILQAGLDKEQGGEIADNLDRLYSFMVERLMQANLKNDPAILDEVMSLLVEIKSGWDGIAEQAKAEA